MRYIYCPRCTRWNVRVGFYSRRLGMPVEELTRCCFVLPVWVVWP